MKIKNLVPRQARDARARVVRARQTLAEVIPAYVYDVQRYIRYSSSNGPYASRENLRSKITATYHNVEKGLSMPHPRAGFGVEPVGNLIRFVEHYVTAHGWEPWLAVPIGVLRSYHMHNTEFGESTRNDIALVSLVRRGDEHLPILEAGVRSVHRADVSRAVSGVGLDFFATRASVRQYANERVDPSDVEFAAAAAQRAPAVCNRQYNQVHSFTDPDAIAAILALQGGARGFADELGGLAIITADLRNFWAAGERNQAFVDGGLFAMNFMNGLHARGLGSVALNWSKTPELDRKLRDLIRLPGGAVIIMLVGYGVLRDQYKVAISHRVPIEQILIRHD